MSRQQGGPVEDMVLGQATGGVCAMLLLQLYPGTMKKVPTLQR